MEEQQGVIVWDCWHVGAAIDYWTPPETVAGTIWRIPLLDGKTLVVVPYQLPGVPALPIHGVPERIEPVLDYSRFGVLVRHVDGLSRSLHQGRMLKDGSREPDSHRDPHSDWNDLRWGSPLEDLLAIEHDEWKPALEEFAKWFRQQTWDAHKEFGKNKSELQKAVEEKLIEAGLAERAQDGRLHRKKDEESSAKQIEKWKAEAKDEGKAKSLAGEKLEKHVRKTVQEKAYPLRCAQQRIRDEILYSATYRNEENLFESERDKAIEAQREVFAKKRESRKQESFSLFREELAKHGAELENEKTLELCHYIAPGLKDKADDEETEQPEPLTEKEIGDKMLAAVDQYEPGLQMFRPVNDRSFRQVLNKIEDVTGIDITASVMESIPFVKVEMDKSTESRRQVLDREHGVRWVVVFKNKRQVLAQSISTEIHTLEDKDRLDGNIPNGDGVQEQLGRIEEQLKSYQSPGVVELVEEAKRDVVVFENNFKDIRVESAFGTPIFKISLQHGAVPGAIKILFDAHTHVEGEMQGWQDVVEAVQVVPEGSKEPTPKWGTENEPTYYLGGKSKTSDKAKCLRHFIVCGGDSLSRQLSLRTNIKYIAR